MKKFVNLSGLAVLLGAASPTNAGDIAYTSAGEMVHGVWSVPEPVSLLLFGAAILALAALSRRRHAASAKSHS